MLSSMWISHVALYGGPAHQEPGYEALYGGPAHQEPGYEARVVCYYSTGVMITV